MAVVVVTGSGGLIGSEAVRHFADQGYDVVGVENDMRAHFFGQTASTKWRSRQLAESYSSFRWLELDICNLDQIDRLFAELNGDIELVVHAAAQPSHDWAASDPQLDFQINANGTLNLLEASRKYSPQATFIFTSTNKVYGDRPNLLPLEQLEKRLELPESHPYYAGIDTTMSIDSSLHSLFGVSKAAADLMVQEYGRNFGLNAVCFRFGCLTGPSHAGAELHGFLSYLMRCTVVGGQYTVFGYDGKQVRDNLHSRDVVSAFSLFHAAPKAGAVYNLGGGRESNCSMLEAIDLCEGITGKKLEWSYEPKSRMGDHRWWISSNADFKQDYPEWTVSCSLESTLQEIYDSNAERWLSKN